MQTHQGRPIAGTIYFFLLLDVHGPLVVASRTVSEAQVGHDLSQSGTSIHPPLTYSSYLFSCCSRYIRRVSLLPKRLLAGFPVHQLFGEPTIMAVPTNRRAILLAIFIAFGGFLFGYDIGVISVSRTISVYSMRHGTEDVIGMSDYARLPTTVRTS